MKVTDALGCLLCGRHGDEAVAAGAGTLGIGHDFGADDLQKRTERCSNRDRALLPGSSGPLESSH